MMDHKKILFINLSKGRVGESNANLLGSMLITKIYLAAMSRADSSKADLKNLPNFYLYVDEFQSFANESFADILSEARKYKLNLTIAHQYIEQMSDEVRAAVFGNVGTMITFRIGSTDAEVMEKEFAPTFIGEDIVNLGVFQIYLRLMIDGIGSQPFSATTLPPLQRPDVNLVEEIIAASRQKYTRPREEIEEVIKKLHQSSNSGGNSSVKNTDNKSDNKNAGNSLSGGGDFRNKTRPVINKNDAVKIEKHFEIKQSEKDQKPQIKKEPKNEVVLPEDNSSLETISLRDLTTKTTQNKPDKKGPSEENRNSLKDALAGILGDLKAVEGVSHDKKPEIKKEPTKEPREPFKPRVSNEIAESELRKILEL